VRTIDINCDLGESFGNWRLGADEEVLPHLTTASVACGFHAGDPVTMARTVERAASLGVAVGAHPGLPDLLGFGRRRMEISAEDAYTYVVYQVGALKAFLEPLGVPLNHVKPHGAFYGTLNESPQLAEAVVKAVIDTMPGQPVLYWPGGVEDKALVQAARAAGVAVYQEYDPDLQYLPSGMHVVERHKAPLAPERAADLVRRFLLEGRIETRDGDTIPLSADSICVHGDGATAAAVVRTIRDVLAECDVRPQRATGAPGTARPPA
jgi:UPF0271 protein